MALALLSGSVVAQAAQSVPPAGECVGGGVEGLALDGPDPDDADSGDDSGDESGDASGSDDDAPADDAPADGAPADGATDEAPADTAALRQFPPLRPAPPA
ncbi:hypothetical protein I4I73_26085 [Pseudonocardia sp. KRD-184]|uniref:hypothetical protein n=1 Tax=Pseudonocardia oceani TaxID=2792013 RepID=UPI001C49CD4F|nr:hypothetical protein [Pseudonocardia oceani]MBW0099471.1 hypothetical protein [Pseudonocardia oceani]